MFIFWQLDFCCNQMLKYYLFDFYYKPYIQKTHKQKNSTKMSTSFLTQHLSTIIHDYNFFDRYNLRVDSDSMIKRYILKKKSYIKSKKKRGIPSSRCCRRRHQKACGRFDPWPISAFLLYPCIRALMFMP